MVYNTPTFVANYLRQSSLHNVYRGGPFYWWKKPENPEKTTDLRKSLTNFITYS